ncbi:MAG TPA: cytidylate kinase family protein [Bryobacteraceae bacterium]|nr:cytidylate kinase family protein [Bryobacteraceae bacterium]
MMAIRMALIAVSGQAGCRFEEVARLASQRLGFELVTQSRMEGLVVAEFGLETAIPESAWADVTASILARLATEHHLVYCAEGAEQIYSHFHGMLRVRVVAPEPVRVGQLMVERRLERPAARRLLRDIEAAERDSRKSRYGLATVPPHLFDLTLNAEALEPEQMLDLVTRAAETMRLKERGLLSAVVEAQLQFQMRLRLASHGIVPPGRARLLHKPFAHHSEEIFARLLDFYRIPWEYEPRTFPVRWDKDGKVAESFTPDFYLPEFDQYIELTTMKQSLVTRKNRKVRLLRQLYPNLNVQVYYQKDVENLIFKYGLGERPVKA